MDSFTKREQMVILLIVFIIIFGLGFKFLGKSIIEPKNMIVESIDLESLDDEIELTNIDHVPEDMDSVQDKEIIIHISGQIYNPGIVKLEMGKRLIDAVELAGGLKKDADIDRINLAKKLVDEEKIYIPEIGEELGENMIVPMDKSTSDNSSNDLGKVNINTGSREELMTLPGIGEKTADKIINYRKDREFKTIDDIKLVSGIGDKKFEAIQELITIE